ncbi:MAG: hypothetical protein II959_08490, partial [Clostridia bacterium]|nr:hypothetical protein [Clostridia bacterium]
MSVVNGAPAIPQIHVGHLPPREAPGKKQQKGQNQTDTMLHTACICVWTAVSVWIKKVHLSFYRKYDIPKKKISGSNHMKIVVLAGGLSPERTVSLSSGTMATNA